MQTNVIGPIEQEDWNILRSMKKTIPYMKNKDPVRYAKGIEAEETWQKEIKAKYLN